MALKLVGLATILLIIFVKFFFLLELQLRNPKITYHKNANTHKTDARHTLEVTRRSNMGMRACLFFHSHKANMLLQEVSTHTHTHVPASASPSAHRETQTYVLGLCSHRVLCRMWGSYSMLYARMHDDVPFKFMRFVCVCVCLVRDVHFRVNPIVLVCV